MELEEQASPAEEADDVIDASPEEARRNRGIAGPGHANQAASGGARADTSPIQAMVSRLCPGQAQAVAPKRQDRGDERIPPISFDCGFATELTKQEGTQVDKREELKVLVVEDERTRTLFAHAVEQKGIDFEERAVEQVAKDFEEVSVKCDQEPSTKALLRRLVRLVNVDVVDQVLHHHPAVGDSQSNGSIENGVKTVMVQLRTMTAALERKLACKIPLDHPVMAWMTTYAAQLLSQFQVGHDGHTPHEWLRGKRAQRRAWEVAGALGKSNILGVYTHDQRVLICGTRPRW